MVESRLFVMRVNVPYFLFLMMTVTLGTVGCKHEDDFQPTISPFTVAVKQRTGVADLKPSHFVNDLVLTWGKAKIPNGDSVTYTVVYKDTLAKNLIDTTFIISNVGDKTTVSGFVVAKTKRGLAASIPFNYTSGMAPRARIKKWISQSETFKYYTVTTYNYDSLGRLTSFNSQEGKVCCFTYGQTTVLTYNRFGQLSRVEALPNGDNTGQFPTYLNTYEYDGKGKLSLIKHYSPPLYYQQTPLEYKYDEKLNYDATGLLVRSTVLNSSYQITYDYTYKNGNLILLKYSNREDSFAYRYDDKPNPFYGLLVSSRQTPAYYTYSINNVVTAGATNTYDSSGLLIKSVSSDPKVSVNTFEYETY